MRASASACVDDFREYGVYRMISYPSSVVSCMHELIVLDAPWGCGWGGEYVSLGEFGFCQ